MIEITDGNGCSARISQFGASLVGLRVPDRDGNVNDVVMGLEDGDYAPGKNALYFGSVVGRCANRIGNATFTLEGKTVKLDPNDGTNALHGGAQDISAWSHKHWDLISVSASSVKLALASPDGDGGYPGDARATVTYTMEPLPGGSHGFTTQLRVAMECECSAPCPVNMVHHAYYNLAGHASGKLVWDHHLEMPRAHFYTPVGANLVPTGEIREVDGTAVDFRRRKRIGDVKEEVEPRGGLDNNLVVRGKEEFEGNRGEIVLAGQAWEECSGRTMAIYSNQPGAQLYGSGFVFDEKGKQGTVYARFSGLCLETQAWPDSVNQANFPDTVARPGLPYRHELIVRFGTFSGPVDDAPSAPMQL